MNYWLTILKGYRDGKFPDYYYGLTPRFILGGCQLPIGKTIETKKLAFELTLQMFNEMQKFNEDGIIVVSNNCDIHNGPVMSLSTNQWSEKAIGTSFDEIWGCYGREIEEGNYHINAVELKILEEIFSK